jgi:uncharacterized protein
MTCCDLWRERAQGIVMPERESGYLMWPRRILIAAVRTYRLLFSPWLGSACRFSPTCSLYSLQALEMHGASVGSYLTLRRLARCHPWCQGGEDPVPLQRPRWAAAWRPVRSTTADHDVDGHQSGTRPSP